MSGSKLNSGENISDNGLNFETFLDQRPIKTSTQKELADTLAGKESYKPKVSKLLENMIQWVYDKSNLDEYEEVQIVKELQSMDLENDWHSKGTEGAVFKISIKNARGEIKEYLIAKKRYDNTYEHERAMQKRALDIIKNNTISDNLVKIPDLKAILSMGEDNFIIMDFVKGKTLYQLQLEEILKKRGIYVGDIASDIDVQSIFFKSLDLNPKDKSDCEKASANYQQNLKSLRLFSPEKGQKYKESLSKATTLLNKNDFYHRDASNPRNIIIGDDGFLYLIDFGRSIYNSDKKLTEKNIYEQQEGEHHVGYYPRDWEAAKELSRYTQTKDDVEFENEQKQHREQIQNIEKGTRLIDVLSTIPVERELTPVQGVKVYNEASTQKTISKRVKISDIESEKNSAKRLSFLLSQSIENINGLNIALEKRIDVLQYEKKITIGKMNVPPPYALSAGEIGVKKYQEPYQKDIISLNKQIDMLQYMYKQNTFLKRKYM